MASIQPYLIFGGNCEEAVKFYCDVFGGETQFMSRYKDTPTDVPAHWKEKIIHMNFIIRGDQLMASDAHSGQMPQVGNNVHLSVNFKKDEKIDDMFKKLATGGKIIMPLAKTFWGANFGMIEDRFGISWMFNQQIEEMK